MVRGVCIKKVKKQLKIETRLSLKLRHFLSMKLHSMRILQDSLLIADKKKLFVTDLWLPKKVKKLSSYLSKMARPHTQLP